MIGLIDIDGRLPNLALMKISNFYKQQGEKVEFVKDDHEYDQIFAASIFTKSKQICEDLSAKYGEKLSIGGTGWDLKKELPEEIESSRPDYTLYKPEDIARSMKDISSGEHRIKKATQIVNAGIGTSIGGL